MKQEQDFKNLCNLTTSLLGMRKGSLALKSRKVEYQVPRAVVSVIARMEDDIHRGVIGKVLKRDRTSVNHYERNHSSNYASWGLYRDTFNKIYNAYISIKDARKTFYSLKDMQTYLWDNKVRNDVNKQTCLQITSGKYQVDIKVSYRNFYNQLENIKLALQDYNYDLKIIQL